MFLFVSLPHLHSHLIYHHFLLCVDYGTKTQRSNVHVSAGSTRSPPPLYLLLTFVFFLLFYLLIDHKADLRKVVLTSGKDLNVLFSNFCLINKPKIWAFYRMNYGPKFCRFRAMCVAALHKCNKILYINPNSCSSLRHVELNLM